MISSRTVDNGWTPRFDTALFSAKSQPRNQGQGLRDDIQVSTGLNSLSRLSRGIGAFSIFAFGILALMNLMHHLTCFAQFDPGSMEMTAGKLMAGLLVLAVSGGSIGMIAVWIFRIVNGQPPLPAAHRRPLYVPLPLAIIGTIWALMMAVSVLFLGNEVPDELKQVQPGVATQAKSVSADTQTTSTETEVTSSIDPVTSDTAAPDTDAGHTDEGIADSNVSEASTGQAVQKKKKMTAAERATAMARFRQMIWTTIVFQLGMFVVFGLAVLLCHQLRPDRSVVESEAEQRILAPAPLATSFSAVPSVSPWGDLDAPPATSTTSEQLTAMSPAAADQGLFEETTEEAATANAADNLHPFAASQVTAAPESGDDPHASPQQPEARVYDTWRFLPELRFAAETFLVAYVPTAAIRIIMVLSIEDPPQHPFLDMLDEGVGIGLMLLIAFTATVVAPIVEELLYRVTVLGGLLQSTNLATAWVTSSVLFALAHGFPDSVALLPLAFVIGYTYIKRRSYRTVVMVHLLFNGFNMALAGMAML